MTILDPRKILTYPEPQPERRPLAPFAVQLAIFFVSYVFAFLVRCQFVMDPPVAQWMWRTLPVVVAVKSLLFPLLGARVGIGEVPSRWRNILAGVILSAGTVFLLNATVFPALLHRIPRSVIVIDALATLAWFALPYVWHWLSAPSDRGDLPEETQNPPTSGQILLSRLAVLLTVAIGLAFPLRMSTELARVGENALGYDYVYYIEHFDKMFSGHYNWLHMPFDSMVSGGSHCMIVPRLIRLPILIGTDWNHHAEIALGILLAGVKVLLLVHLLGRGWPLVGRCALFALVSGLTFTLRHFASFQFGPAAMNQQLADVFFLGGCWFVIHQKRGWLGGMSACGLCASLSYGSGLFCWPTYFLGMGLMQVRRWKPYAAGLIMTAVSAAPYVLYRVWGVGIKRTMEHNLFPIHLWMKSMTLPFFTMDEMDQADEIWIAIGGASLLLGFLLTLFAFLRYWHRDRAALAPPMMILLCPLGTLWLISFGRSEIASWYSVHYALIWTGILGLAFLLSRPGSGGVSFARPRGFGWLAMMTAAFLVLILIPGNRSTAGKVTFLTSRSPAAVSALREFRTAPTHYAFHPYRIWRANHNFYTRYATMLEKHGWSVFGKHRLYFLQGDFGLNTVTLHEQHPAPPIVWIEERTPTARDYTDYRRLNLLMHSSHRLTWELTIPAETSSAVFQTAVARPRHAKALPNCQVQLAAGSGPAQVVWTSTDPESADGWQDCEIPLDSFAGQTIRLTLSSESDDPQSAAVWRSPLVEMKLKRIPPAGETIAPSNATPEQFPAFTPEDLVLEMTPAAWFTPKDKMTKTGSDPLAWRIHSNRAWVDYHRPFEVTGRDYSHFYLACALSRPDAGFHNVSVVFHCEVDGEIQPKHAFVPLLPSDELREYCIDLRKLEIYPDTKIVKVTFAPASDFHKALERQFELAEARFIKRH